MDDDELAELELHLAGLTAEPSLAVRLAHTHPADGVPVELVLEDRGGTPVGRLVAEHTEARDGVIVVRGRPVAGRPVEGGVARGRRARPRRAPVLALDGLDEVHLTQIRTELADLGAGARVVVVASARAPERETLALLDRAERVLGGSAPVELLVLPSRADTTPLRREALTRLAAGARVVDRCTGVAGHRRGDGVVVLLTGLSGSGKSTVARALADHLLRHDPREVTLLDGDEVRRHLSAGLGFSPEDRRTNLLRIAWVAGLVARHGGIALCAPIAPYARVRAEMRELVEPHGRLVLVHVSTPIEVCEARDRKGLYARARAGEITGFTGIDDPYEEPLDADLVLDTSEVGVEDAVRRIAALLG
nr:adenylyl-sulfate kinase [Cellulomonas sp. APG4]